MNRLHLTGNSVVRLMAQLAAFTQRVIEDDPDRRVVAQIQGSVLNEGEYVLSAYAEFKR